MYSITPIQHHHISKDGTRKVILQVIYQRKKVYFPTPIKLLPGCWDGSKAIKTANKTEYNNIIKEGINVLERRLLNAIKIKPDLTKRDLSNLIKNVGGSDGSVVDFVLLLVKELKGKFSSGRLKHYVSITNKITDFGGDVTFADINMEWLRRFERRMRDSKLSNNTIKSQVQLLKAIFRKASERGLLQLDQFEHFKSPKYIQKIPVYLTESEVDQFQKHLTTVAQPSYKLAGYYFLLSCFTGYRISDAKIFNYHEMVSDNSIVLRAKKNGEVVSIPIHTKLRGVLDYIKDKPLKLSEGKLREFVKHLAVGAGIQKNITYHSSRHSWAMLLMSKGLSVEEVAETLGDSVQVARIYARITNKSLHDKIKDRLG